MDALRTDLGWALRAISIEFQERGAQAVAEIPSGARGYLVLLAASDGSSPTQLELAQALGINKTRMTYLLDDLEAAHLITRTPDPADRRARLTTLTARGEQVLGDARRALAAVETHILRMLPPADQRALRAALVTVATGAEETCA